MVSICPISGDDTFTIPSLPCVLAKPTTLGKTVYPLPGKLIFVLNIGPLAVGDVVLYVIVLTPTLETNFCDSSGFSFKLKVNVLSSLIKTLCSFLRTISLNVMLFLPVTSVSDDPNVFLVSDGTTGVRS